MPKILKVQLKNKEKHEIDLENIPSEIKRLEKLNIDEFSYDNNEDESLLRIIHENFEIHYFEFISSMTIKRGNLFKRSVISEIKPTNEIKLNINIDDKEYNIFDLALTSNFILEEFGEYEIAKNIKLKKYNGRLSIVMTL